MLEGSPSSYPALQSAIKDSEDEHTGLEFQPSRTSSPKNLFLLAADKSKGLVTPEFKAKHMKSVEIKVDAEADKKPPGLSYIALISMAIQSAKTKKMLLSEIYQWISDRYPYYQLKDKSWRNSIRHNLSLNECFVKSGRSENGKGNYWSIHPANMEDFARGDYRRRRARRRVRICDKDLQQLCVNGGGSTKLTSPVPKITPYDGYIPMASTVVPGNFMTSFGPDCQKNQFEWYPSDYFPCKTYDFKPIQSNLPPRDSACNYQGNIPQQNSDYYSYAGSPTYFPNSPNSCAQPESKFNVNVSVNVCGNGSSEQQPSPNGSYHSGHRPSQPERPIPQQPDQHQMFTPHYQSAFTSTHYSQMYGGIYQENLATPIL